ncbi:hypothetical protein SAL_1260, partial [Streptococcus agalactiae 515]
MRKTSGKNKAYDYIAIESGLFCMPKRTSLDMTLNAKGESNQILVDKEVHSTNL